MIKKIRSFLNNHGQNTVEYALIIGFVVTIAVIVLGIFREEFTTLAEQVRDKIREALGKITGGG